MDLEGLKKRARWSINHVTDKKWIYKLSNKTLAEKMGVNKGTVSNYRTMINVPKIEFIDKFCNSFEFNIDWFLYGNGEPYPGARDRYPEVCGPELGIPLSNKEKFSIIGVAEPVSEYGAGVDYFGKAVAGLKEIFDSRDPVLIPAIQANIHAFQISVRRERHIQQQSDEITALKKENTNIKARLEAIEKKVM